MAEKIEDEKDSSKNDAKNPEYDEVLTRFEISNKVIDFVDYNYDKYMEDYSNFIKNELGKTVYGIVFWGKIMINSRK